MTQNNTSSNRTMSLKDKFLLAYGIVSVLLTVMGFVYMLGLLIWAGVYAIGNS